MKIKPMKTKELIRLIESFGYRLIKNSKHCLYGNGITTVLIPHSNTTSTGMVQHVIKTLRSNGHVI